MRTVMAAFVVVIVLSFSFTVHYTAAQTSHAQDSTGNVGLAAFGPFVSGFYEVVRGQNLSSSLAIKNTGRVLEDIEISATVLGDADKISFSISEEDLSFSIFPDEVRMIDVCLEILSNETDYITLELGIRAYGRDLKNDTNIIECGIRVSSVFHIAGEGLLLVVYIVDQRGDPYTDGLEVEVLRDIIVSYGRHYPDSNASYHTMLAKGNYTVRVWRGEEIAKSVDFELTKDLVLTIRVDKPAEPSGFLTLHLLEIGLGLIAGYSIRVFEVRYRKRRKHHKEKITTSPEERELAQYYDWSEGRLG